MKMEIPKRFYQQFSRDSLSRIIQWGAVIAVGMVLGLLIIFLYKFPPKFAPLVLIGVMGIFGVMIIGDIKKILLAAILIDIPLRLDIYLGSSVLNPPLGMRFGWMIALTSAALAGLYVLHMVKEFVKPGSQPKILLRENLPLTFYIFFVTLSIVVARFKVGSLYQIFFLAQMYFLALYFASLVRNRDEILFVMAVLLIGISLEGLVMIGQMFFGLNIQFGGISTVVWHEGGRRAAGTLGSPNVAAGYLTLFLAPALSFLFTDTSFLYKGLAFFAYCLGAAGLLLTQSRGGIISMIISTAILILAATWRGKLPVWILIGGVIVGGILLLVVSDILISKIFGARTESALARVHLAQIALRVIAKSPIFGVGANNYALNINDVLTPELSGEFIYTVHNKYLLVFAETGIGGILSFLWFLLATIRRGWNIWMQKSPLYSMLALGIAAAIIGQMVHMTVEIFDSRAQVQPLWILAALIVSMDVYKEKI
jgi:O-antigen ligase